MEKIRVEDAIYGIEMEWESENCEFQCENVKNQDMKKWLEELSESMHRGIHLKMKEDMEEGLLIKQIGYDIGKLIILECQRLKTYQGHGICAAGEKHKNIECELFLPGRTDWVFEISAIKQPKGNEKIIKLLSQIAQTAQLRVKIQIFTEKTPDDTAIIQAFGNALQQAFSPIYS